MVIIISCSLWSDLNVFCSEKLSKIPLVRIELFLSTSYWSFGLF